MTDQSKPYTPLTTENSALVLVDHQVGLMTGVRDYETGELKHNVVALAKAAKVLRIPTVVTTTARDSMWGPTFPELVEVVGRAHIIDRSSVNAWDDPKVAAAIEATGRKKLIITGISPEVCLAFPAISATAAALRATCRVWPPLASPPLKACSISWATQPISQSRRLRISTRRQSEPAKLAPIAAEAKPPQPSKSKKSNGNRSAEPVTIAD